MGNLCAGKSDPTPVQKPKNMKITSNMETPKPQDSWKTVKLPEKLTIKCPNKCNMEKFSTGIVTEEMKNQPDDSEDENKWLCNGASEEEGFIGGCKSG